MSPSSPSTRPSAGQSLVILLAAVVLVVSGCFGAFGIGFVNRNALQAVALLTVALVMLFAIVGFVIGGVRLVRALFARPAAADTPPVVVTHRPGFGQTFVIFTAGVVAFSGACMALADGGNSASGTSKVLFTLVFLTGVAAAAAGFGLLLWPRTTIAAPAEAPPPAPPTATDPPMEPRA